jgi:ribosomal protein S18 acetylase RimI-like enzyme
MNTPTIRSIARCDLWQIMEIERQCYGDDAWDCNDLHDMLWTAIGSNVFGWVATFHSEVVGYLVFAVMPYHFELLNFATAKEYRGCGIARSLIERLVAKMHSDRKGQITCLVPDTNLQAHLALQALGFRASKVLRNCYLNTHSDAYRFVQKASPLVAWGGRCQLQA